MKKTCLFFFVLMLTMVGLSTAAEWHDDSYDAAKPKAEAFLDSVKKAISENPEEVNFWSARYMGEVTARPAGGYSAADLDTILNDNSVALNWATVDRSYSRSFQEWFLHKTALQWDVPDQAAERSSYYFEVPGGQKTDTYFASVFISPIVHRGSIGESSTTLLPLVDYQQRAPYILSGKSNFKQGTVLYYHNAVIDPAGRYLQYVWPVDVADVDGDGVAEIWVRYNALENNGFSQELDIYRIVNNADLVLMKKFVGHDGGVARRVSPNFIETAEGGSDKMTIETWRFQDGDFTRAGTRTVPNILKSDAWKEFY